MIKITARVIEEYCREATFNAFPVIIEIESDENVMISERIDVKEIILVKEGAQFGEQSHGWVSRGQIGEFPGEIKLEKQKPHFQVYDLLTYDGVSLIQSGKYTLKIRLMLYEKSDGKVKWIEAATARQVHVQTTPQFAS